MNYYLVDYENVHNDGVKELSNISAGDVVVIFYSDHCKNITLDTVAEVLSKGASLEATRAFTGTKNALDFQLSYYIGLLHGTSCKDAKYFIVSNDKGYDCLCEYIKEKGINIARMTTKSNPASASKANASAPASTAPKTTANEPKKQASKTKSSDMATLEEMKKILSKDEKPEDVLEIFNQNKTKCDIHNSLVKKFKSTKKGSAIYKKLKSLLAEKNKS